MRAANSILYTIYNVKLLCADIYCKNEHTFLFTFRRRINNIFFKTTLIFFLHQNVQSMNYHDFCILTFLLSSNFRKQTIYFRI